MVRPNIEDGFRCVRVTGIRPLVVGILILTAFGCGHAASKEDSPAARYTIFLRPVEGAKTAAEVTADTNALSAAFKAGGFVAVHVVDDPKSAPLADDGTVYVNAVAGGDEYCLEALVRQEQGLKGQGRQFEWRQSKVVGGAVLNRQSCASAFVASLKAELAR